MIVMRVVGYLSSVAVTTAIVAAGFPCHFWDREDHVDFLSYV
jgi:hypothetical protein